MRRLPLLLSISLLAVAHGCGEVQSDDDEAKRVARAYVEAWCRGDGAHAKFEFRAEDLPEPFRELPATTHALPQGVEPSKIEVVTVKFMGPGNSPELPDYTFWIRDAQYQADSTCVLGILLRVRFPDDRVETAQIGLRPDVPFEKGVRPAVSLEQRWRVLPRSQ